MPRNDSRNAAWKVKSAQLQSPIDERPPACFRPRSPPSNERVTAGYSKATHCATGRLANEMLPFRPAAEDPSLQGRRALPLQSRVYPDISLFRRRLRQTTGLTLLDWAG